jgi:hypothetical protein
MILTLVAQTSKWASGLKKAAGQAVTFGSVVKGAMKMVGGALLGLAGSIILFLPNFIRMGEEARKSERRLQNVAEQMGTFGKNTETVTKRLSDYAETLSYLTGVDDEAIRANEAVLLTFSNLAKTAGTIGAPFDRAVLAMLDLEAAGKDIKAVGLGKALQDPVGSLKALTKAGILFTKAEKERIKKLVESNQLLGAQDLVLKKIEDQVGGTAAATASATDRMSARFENVVETLSIALLPAVDDIAQAMSDWLDSGEGKKAIDDLAKSFADFGSWVTSADGKAAIESLMATMKLFGETVLTVAAGIKYLIKLWEEWTGTKKDLSFNAPPGAPPLAPNPNIPVPTQGNPTTVPPRASIVVNFNTPVDSISAGREIARVLTDYERTRGRQ